MTQQTFTSPQVDYSYFVNNNPQPTANITVRKNRVKQYGSNIYLKNGTNFEIELWNPKQNRVLAKISLNGQEVSGGGIVLNPGQRVYIERFIDEDRKFKFVTYDAENSPEGRKAIQNNGDVEVKFYDEVFNVYQQPYTICTDPFWWNNGTGGSPIYGGCTTNMGGSYSNTMAGDFNFSSNDSMNVSGEAAAFFCSMDLNQSKEIETGRVEKGEKSNQDFSFTNGDFSYFTCATYFFKILPKSQQPTPAGEIRAYCTTCGRKWKRGENFCPTCGTPNK